MPAPQPAAAATPDRNALYEEMRRRAQQQGLAAQQQQSDAMKRRFAAIGNLNSGAYVKASQQADQAAQAQTADAIRAVDMQKAQEDLQVGEAQKGRDLQQALFDKDQAFKQQVFQDESKFRNLDFDESKKANELNAVSALTQLSDEALRSLGGASQEWGDIGNRLNLEAILKRYGYQTPAAPAQQPQRPVYYNPLGLIGR